MITALGAGSREMAPSLRGHSGQGEGSASTGALQASRVCPVGPAARARPDHAHSLDAATRLRGCAAEAWLEPRDFLVAPIFVPHLGAWTRCRFIANF
jgi:hypothetical protein